MALEIYERELVIREASLGSDHPDLGYALFGLAVTSRNMGLYEDSAEYYRRTIALQEAALGPDSHYLAMTRIPVYSTVSSPERTRKLATHSNSH